MTLAFTITLGNDRRTWPLDGETLRIGRSSQNAIQIADPTVSKEHAEIGRRGAEYVIRDLDSRNGTRVNGIEAREPIVLHEGDMIEIGKVLGRIGSDAAEQKTVFSPGKGLGSSLRLRAQEILAKPPREGAEASRLVHLLAEAGRVLVLPKPLRETCEEILGFIERAVPASRLVVLLSPPGGGEPVPMASRIRGAGRNDPLAISRSILDLVINECASVLVQDTALDPRFAAQQSIVAQSIHSAVPLFDNERVLGVLYADSRDLGNAFGQEQLEVLTLLANMGAVKITNARLLEFEQSRLRMTQELATATRIQRNLLPEPPRLPGWQIDARLESCNEVGGDLYDFHRRADGSLVFLVGDVSGKGMGAALLMSSTLSSLRTLYDQCPDPAELAARLNAVLHRSTDPGHFVTLWIGVLELGSGRLIYVNAGHNPPMVLDRDGLRRLEVGGVPIAILEGAPYEAGETTLDAGALLAIFTDGIPEADRDGEQFDEPRLIAALEAGAATPLDVLGRAVIGRVDEFLAGTRRGDDITLLLIRRDRA